ncbi:MAG: hypothetical protein AAF216_13040 [Pseudomonadota bacterium]
MSFAKQIVIGCVRIVRQAGTVGLFVLGLLVGSAIIAQSPSFLPTAPEDAPRMAANAAERPALITRELPREPWSRVIGKPGYEKITDVTLGPNNTLVFAGISLGQRIDGPSSAMLVRTGPHGFVHNQALIDDARLGSVTRAVLSDDGTARLVHWVGSNPGFASVAPDGGVTWSRTFEVDSQTVWAEIEVADRGETLIALTEGDGRASTRIIRLDESGKVLWRHHLEGVGNLDQITLADSGDGGALLTTERVQSDGNHEIAMERIDRRGQQVWQRMLYNHPGASLAHADLSAAGGVVLVGGEPSAVFRFDAMGQLNWVRQVPALDPAGRHMIGEGPGGDWHILAEPLTQTQTRRHWMARFDEDGGLRWSHMRANRAGTSLEAAIILENGAIVAGGSLPFRATGDTDMLLMTIGDGGRFPKGLEGDPTPAVPEQKQPIILASASVDTATALAPKAVDATLAAEVEYRAVAAQSDIEPLYVPAEQVLDAQPIEPVAPQSLHAELPVVLTKVDDQPVEQPIVVAAVLEPEPVVSDVVPTAAVVVSPVAPGVKPDRVNASLPVIEPASLKPVVEVASVEVAQSFSYVCRFTCLADSEDIVPYPVSRIIGDASEANADLFSLDIMAMDNSVCLSTGGRVYDRPRIPPTCKRLD